MGWYDIVSLLADSRIRFLMGFVIVAIILAIIIILVEIMLKERDRRKDVQFEQTPTDRISIYINSNRTLQEKFSYLNKTAKEYFEDMYNIPIETSYSKLVKKLEGVGKKNEIEFCKMMFEIFYSKRGLNKIVLNSLTRLLIEIEAHRTVERKVVIKQKKSKIGIFNKGAEDALGIKNIKEKKLIIKGSKEKTNVKEGLISSGATGEKTEKGTEKEIRNKKRLEILAKHEERQRQKEKQAADLKKQAEDRIKSRIEERKILVDKKLSKRTEIAEEKKRNLLLSENKKQFKKDKKREIFWKEKTEKANVIKLKNQERANAKKLLEERRSQILEEKKKLNGVKINPVISEAAGMTKIEQNKVGKIDRESEGIAAKIVRLERERLEREGV